MLKLDHSIIWLTLLIQVEWSIEISVPTLGTSSMGGPGGPAGGAGGAARRPAGGLVGGPAGKPAGRLAGRLGGGPGGGLVGGPAGPGGGASGEGAVAEKIKDSLKRHSQVTGCERCS